MNANTSADTNANGVVQPMFPEEECGKGMPKEKRDALIMNHWVSRELARQHAAKKLQTLVGVQE